MMRKNTVTFISRYDYSLQSFIKQCYELGVSDDFHIEGRTIDQLSFLPIKKDSLIVLSSTIIQEFVMEYIPANTKVIIAHRTISYLNIREMLEIPRGMKVLLVSDRKERAIETVALLTESGVHLDFYPYYPGASYPEDIQIAVTPGEARHVPSGMQKVVDIRSRVIDLTTWLEIYAHFNYESIDLRKISARYVQSLVYITGELNSEIEKANLLRRHLEAIVDRMEDAVLAIDEEECIRITNPKAMDIFQLEGKDLTNQKAKNCIPSDFFQIVSEIPYEQEEVINWESTSFFIRKTRIMIEGKNFGYLILFRKASEINKLEHDYRRKVISKGLVAKYSFDDLTVSSHSFKDMLEISKKVAKNEATILLLGETGTGKELLAQAIHNASPRKREPFVGINFAAISETLLESELFGYEEGAFTGARKGGHIGLFEKAHKGTIFLDEIGDASSVIQNRLLRVLQEREIMRVGGDRIIPIDIRVIAATNQDLEKMVETREFRADLYYRLNVVPIYLPPLRERKEDITALSYALIKKICARLKRPVFTISQEALDQMLRYHWPGNIRELENMLEYLALVVEDVATPWHLALKMKGSKQWGDHTEFANDVVSEIDHLQNLFETYSAKEFVSDIKVILQAIADSNSSLGRNSIKTQLEREQLYLTEQQLRYRLKMLKEHHLVEVGKGRQGSSLTETGASFLSFLKRK